MSNLCEVMAIVRTNKMTDTKKALEEIGYPSFTAFRCFGRGKQGGRLKELAYPVSPEIKEKIEQAPASFIPKRIIMAVVPEDTVPKIVEIIIRVNQTGEHGDGKIFVFPVEDTKRVRTGDSGLEALL